MLILVSLFCSRDFPLRVLVLGESKIGFVLLVRFWSLFNTFDSLLRLNLTKDSWVYLAACCWILFIRSSSLIQFSRLMLEKDSARPGSLLAQKIRSLWRLSILLRKSCKFLWFLSSKTKVMFGWESAAFWLWSSVTCCRSVIGSLLSQCGSR